MCMWPVEARPLYLNRATHYVLLQLRKFLNMSADQVAAYALVFPRLVQVLRPRPPLPLQCLNELTLECMCFSYAVFFFPYMNIYIYIYI